MCQNVYLYVKCHHLYHDNDNNNNNSNSKTVKYANLGTQFIFQPIAVELLGPMHESA